MNIKRINELDYINNPEGFYGICSDGNGNGTLQECGPGTDLWFSTDGYWNKDGYRSWVILRVSDEAIQSAGRFFVPEKYKEQYSRCDLHPRWRPDGTQLAFNSVHDGTRQVYLRDVKW